SLGMQLAAGAGWDPAALASILSTMQAEERLHGGKEPRFSFLASHPSTPERVRSIATEAGSFPVAKHAPIAADRAATLRHLDGLAIGNDPAQGMFVKTRFLHPELDLAIDFPDAWKVQNSRNAVVAAAPKGDALSLLRPAVGNEDLNTLARQAATNFGLSPDVAVERTTIAGNRAARLEAQARMRDGTPVQLYQTWIEHHGRVLEILGACALGSAPAYAEALRSVARSFRGLTAADWPSIQATRLRLQTAKGSESVASLAARLTSEWRPEEIAVANGVHADAMLAEGFAVKVALKEPYRVKEK
ncbi:MAG: hypothetical protein HY270_19305, partial [Deltaproteobacteria bacterium]|nr:hypothetical protein [Deltaproteobacteria bacterium]